MRHYLRRVLARTTGQTPGGLQAARRQHWSSQAADPFVAADADVPEGPDRAAPRIEIGAPGTGTGPRGEWPAPPATGSWIASGVVSDAAGALDTRSRPRRVLDRAVRPEDGRLPPSERRRARGEAQPPTGEPVRSVRAPAVAGGLPAEIHPSSATASRAAALLVPPATPRPGDPAAERRTEPAKVAMPLPVAPRRAPAPAVAPVELPWRDPAAAAAPEEPRAQSIAAGELRLGPPAAAPIQHAARPASAAAARPEIVIGRISVVVDGARPPEVAPRTIVRRATAGASTADETGGSQRFGRFGLGQL